LDFGRRRKLVTDRDAVASVSLQKVDDNRMTQVARIAGRLERLPMTSYQHLIILIVATAFFFDSMDLGAMTFTLGSIKQTFALSSADVGLLASMSFFGMVFGAAAAGMLADRYGRVVIFQVSMILWGTSSVLCGLAPDVIWLGVFRVLLGIGMGMEFPLAQSIVSEMAPTKVRGRYTALLDGGWPAGFIASGILCLIVLSFLSWRWVFILEGVPAVFVFVIRRRVPESPRWLADRSHYERAEVTMSMIEDEVWRRTGKPLAEPQMVLQVASGGRRAPFLDLWRGEYVKRSIMVWTLWFFALLGFYGLTTWLGALLQQAGYAVMRSVYYTVLISLAGIPGFLASAWLVEAWGRKAVCVATLVGSAIMTYLYGSAGSLAAMLCFGLLMQFFMFGMWAVLYAYTPELYPTRARATGCGYASSIGRIGALIGPTVVGLVLPSAGQSGVFALGAGAFALAAVVVLVLGEETKGRALEAISQ